MKDAVELRQRKPDGEHDGLQEAWDVDRAGAMLEAFLGRIGRGMLFMRSLRRVRLQRWDPDVPAASPLRQVLHVVSGTTEDPQDSACAKNR